LPRGLQVGGHVDLWASFRDAASNGTRFGAPRQLAAAVEVYAVRSSGAGLTTVSGGAVEVLVGPEELASLLDALANGAKVAVVVVPGAEGVTAGQSP
jgi:cold shock CspA family protein